jgi:hypothetical protein
VPNDLVLTDAVPPTKCPECGVVNSGALGVDGTRPKKGDVSICMYCRHISIFTEDLGLREPTIDEMLAMGREPKIQAALSVLAKCPPPGHK